MARSFRKVAKYGAIGAGALGVSTAAIVLPPKEVIPPVLLPSRVLFEGIGRVGRCVYVGGQIFFDYTVHVKPTDSQEEWNTVHHRCAKRLVCLAETNGGLYVKAGQIFANMSHILPYQYCEVMTVLQDAVVKRPYSEVVAVLENDLGMPIDQVFSYVDPVPLAAASLAQVHRGRLKREEEEVAIKVQYIDIATRFKGDMRTINLMLDVAGHFFPGYDLGKIVQKLNDTVAAELDFRLEAANSNRAANELREGGFGDRVVCPTIYWDYVSRRVLISKFVSNSVKISDREGIEKLGLDVKEVARNFYDALSFEIFRTGFFHGDPHAGNVLVHKLRNGKPQVVLLDFGLCAELDPYHRREISDIWTASTTHNSPAIKEIAARYNCDDYELFASCFLQHPYVYFSSSSGGGRLTTKEALNSMRDTMKHKMAEVNEIISALPKEYALVLRSIMATKAINRELGDAVNRPMRMLKYSMQTSHEDVSRWTYARLMMKAWMSEIYSSVILSFTKWRHPEVREMLETSLQVSG